MSRSLIAFAAALALLPACGAGAEEPPAGHPHVLCLEEQMPAPGGGGDVERPEKQGRGEPGQRCLAGAGPEPGAIDAGEEQGEQRHADDDLQSGHQMSASVRSGGGLV